MFWKTVIFGNICQIWHHLATLSKVSSKQKYNGRRSGQRSRTTGNFYITHSLHVQDDVLRTARRCNNFGLGFIWWLLVCYTVNTALFQYLLLNVNANAFPKLVKAYSAVYEISKNGPIFLHLACQGVGGAHPCPTVSYATTHSRKVPPPPSHGLKQSQAFQEGIIS